LLESENSIVRKGVGGERTRKTVIGGLQRVLVTQRKMKRKDKLAILSGV
jgi:hypothetical protein